MYVNARAIIERETAAGTELLLQMSARPGLPAALEFPGGRLEEYEPILAALEREVLEETTKGPVDSVGFFFRCRAEGELTTNGDAAFGHRWLPVPEAGQLLQDEPEAFDWLTQAALRFYLASSQYAGARSLPCR